MTIFGTYAANNSGSVQAYADWLGSPPGLASVHTGQGSWSDFEGSPDWCIWANGWTRGPICVSVPLTVNGCPLSEVASGAHDASLLIAAKKVLAKLGTPRPADSTDNPAQDVIYLRTGWEFTLSDEMPWSVGPNSAADFVAAWRRFVGVFRSVDTGKRFRFVWCPNVGWADPWPSYPGDDVVDVVGVDMYAHPGQWGEPVDPMENWNHQLSLGWGPKWLVQFAASRGKPACFPEWGVNSDVFGPYIQAFHDFCIAHDVLYANYWDSNGDYAGQMSSGQYPTAGVVFKSCFGTASAQAAPALLAAITKGLTMSKINLHLTGDAYQGPPIADINLDGAAVPSVPITAAQGSAPQVVSLDAAAGSHVVTVVFGKDAYGGAPDKDRNLYLESVDVDGVDQGVARVAFLANSSTTIPVTIKAVLTLDGLDARLRVVETALDTLTQAVAHLRQP